MTPLAYTIMSFVSHPKLCCGVDSEQNNAIIVIAMLLPLRHLPSRHPRHTIIEALEHSEHLDGSEHFSFNRSLCTRILALSLSLSKRVYIAAAHKGSKYNAHSRLALRDA